MGDVNQGFTRKATRTLHQVRHGSGGGGLTAPINLIRCISAIQVEPRDSAQVWRRPRHEHRQLKRGVG